ncbi:VOC family protein [Streptomyces sp. NPDC060005]|uniref:VOC family protein n=1 Tax=Streptomyces sp. NPDC060005 TaxID=3347034 RepID=UPI003683FF5E
MGTSSKGAGDSADEVVQVGDVDMKVEVVVIPVSDVDAAKAFYGRLGWRLDVTPPGVVQFTPQGSACSVQFGANLSTATPGSAKGYLVVADLPTVRNAMIAAKVAVSEIFHPGPDGPVDGPDPDRRSYFSRASFSDPDGNEWMLQEVTRRLPGRIDPGEVSFSSSTDLASAMRRAKTAHGEHERRTGEADANWPDWYAQFIASEQSGQAAPQ